MGLHAVHVCAETELASIATPAANTARHLLDDTIVGSGLAQDKGEMQVGARRKLVARCAANAPLFVCSGNDSKQRWLSLGFCVVLDLTHGTRNLMSFVHSSGMGISETDEQSTMRLKDLCESRMRSLGLLLRMARDFMG